MGGVCPGGCIPACNGADTPCGQTDTCENITFAFAGGNYWVQLMKNILEGYVRLPRLRMARFERLVVFTEGRNFPEI